MITGIILASGFSRRMKKDKLLMDIEGEKIVERVIRACVESDLDEIILIYRKKEVKKIGEKYNINTYYNENAHLGQSEGLKLGVKNTLNTEYMFFVGDQPFITSELINELIYQYRSSNLPMLVPYYNGNRGMPMIISSIYREELLQIVGDKGARDIVKRNMSKVKKVDIEEEILGMDIDDEEDFRKFKK